MEELINIKNEEAVTTSLKVAEFFHKENSKVMRSIVKLIEGLPKNGETYFMK